MLATPREAAGAGSQESVHDIPMASLSGAMERSVVFTGRDRIDVSAVFDKQLDDRCEAFVAGFHDRPPITGCISSLS